MIGDHAVVLAPEHRVFVTDGYVGVAIVGRCRLAAVCRIQRYPAFDRHIGGAGKNGRNRVLHREGLSAFAKVATSIGYPIHAGYFSTTSTTHETAVAGQRERQRRAARIGRRPEALDCPRETATVADHIAIAQSYRSAAVTRNGYASHIRARVARALLHEVRRQRQRRRSRVADRDGLQTIGAVAALVGGRPS